MDLLVKFASVLGTVVPEIAEFFSAITDAIIPEPIGEWISDTSGSLLTVIAPIWNPLWEAFSEMLELFFGF